MARRTLPLPPRTALCARAPLSPRLWGTRRSQRPTRPRPRTSYASSRYVQPDLLFPHVSHMIAQTFWSPSKSAIVSNINGGEWRTGIDVNSILTSIHQFDPATGCDADTFQPCSDRALINHKTVVDSFRTIYGVNSNASSGQAAAVGRYAEDVYYGGNVSFVLCLREQCVYVLIAVVPSDIRRGGTALRRDLPVAPPRQNPRHLPLATLLPTSIPERQSRNIQCYLQGRHSNSSGHTKVRRRLCRHQPKIRRTKRRAGRAI
jgi:hypothetical protein